MGALSQDKGWWQLEAGCGGGASQGVGDEFAVGCQSLLTDSKGTIEGEFEG